MNNESELEQTVFLLQKILLGQAKMEERIRNIELAVVNDPWTAGREYEDDLDADVPF